MMLTFVFYRLVRISLLASVIAGLTLVLKYVFKNKLSPKWHYGIWFILLSRLLIPIDIDLPYAMITDQVISEEFIYDSVISYFDSKTYQNLEWSSDLIGEKMPEKRAGDRWLAIFSYIWAIALGVIFVIKLYGEWIYRKEISQARKLLNPRVERIKRQALDKLGLKRDIGIYIHTKSKVPKVYGLFRPIIILSEDILYKFEDEQLQFILLHELCHIKRKDILLNVLRDSLKYVYFFNPFLFWCLGRMSLDCEISCDAMVLEKTSEKAYMDYGYTLIEVLRCSREKERSLAVFLGRKKDMVRRIEMIKIYKRKGMVSHIMGLTLVGIVLLVGSLFSFAASEEQVIYDDNYTDNQVRDLDTEDLVFIQPIENKIISAYFGTRYFAGKPYYHDGVDIPAPEGTDIYAAEAGEVVYVDLNGEDHGNLIVIEHKSGIKTLYGQCKEIFAEAGTYVNKGDLIAQVGSSGRSTGPHLHLGVRKDGEDIDPKIVMDWIE